MRQADVAAVAAIEARAYAFPWTPGIFRDCLDTGYQCWVADTTDGLQGYGVLSIGADEAQLLNLCVDPAVHRRGLGRRLLRRMVDLARWHMADRIFLEVRPSNPGAQALYASEGFLPIGRRPRYYPASDGREDAIVMALDLTAPGPRRPSSAD
ncbi:MAG TPA: ribosomal-protein-alanine N-acetyltransferase [Xanthomonadaceae bacterium]|nr:ribosomal-protein-alanine N-acetyltransferase [Xanthomonadaceae bacterium]